MKAGLIKIWNQFLESGIRCLKRLKIKNQDQRNQNDKDIQCCYVELSLIQSDIDIIEEITSDFFFDNISLVKECMSQLIAKELILSISRLCDASVICGKHTLTLIEFIKKLRDNNTVDSLRFKSLDNIIDIRHQKLAHNQLSMFDSCIIQKREEKFMKIDNKLPCHPITLKDFKNAYSILENAFQELQQKVYPQGKLYYAVIPLYKLPLYHLKILIKKAILYDKSVKDGIIKEDVWPLWKWGDQLDLWKQYIGETTKKI